MKLEGEVQSLGFYTTRFVCVPALEAAEDAAVAQIKDDPKLKGFVLNTRDDPPRVHVETIELAAAHDVPNVVQGFVFYPND